MANRLIRALRDLPIKQKVTAIIMLVTTAALLLSGFGVVVMDSVLFRVSMQRDLSALAEIVAGNSTAALAFNDPQSAAETLASLRARPHLVAGCLYRSIAAQVETSAFATYLRPGETTACPGGEGPDQLRFTAAGLMIRRPVILNQRRIGALVLLYDLGEVAERAQLYGLTVLLVLVISSLFAFLLSSRLRALIVEPVARLAHAATAVSETQDYSVRAEKLSNDELGGLADGFNEMLARIQSQDRDLRKALEAQEAALRETQEVRDSLQTTLASIGDAVISTDVEGRVVFVNQIAKTLLRQRDEDLRGKPLQDVFHIVNEFTREAVESPVSKVLREGTIVGMANHTILVAADGTEIPIDDSGAPIRSASGAIEGTVLVFRDVTARRRADDTSRRLASIVESSNDAIFSKDLNGIVTSWNNGAERIFGFPAEEIVGKPVAAIVPEDRHDEIWSILDRIKREERIQHFETIRRTKAGNLLNSSLTVSPMHDPLGRVVGASVISRDITEQVRAAERLAGLNADLQASNRTLALTNQDLERFAFIASHDLQEPLRMITAYSQLLIKSYAGGFDKNAASYVGTIVEGTKRMRELLADLLAYTEIRARDEEPPEVIDLNLVFANVLQNLKTAIEESHAVVTVDPLPVVDAFRGHFQPLFQNLIGNAIKYRGQDPPRIHVSVELVEGVMQFTFSDNGIGIEPAYHKQIFEVFKRLHGKSIPGTGVGLAICQRIVERYGGRIWVESTAGQGSKFIFTLPGVEVERHANSNH